MDDELWMDWSGHVKPIDAKEVGAGTTADHKEVGAGTTADNKGIRKETSTNSVDEGLEVIEDQTEPDSQSIDSDSQVVGGSPGGPNIDEKKGSLIATKDGNPSLKPSLSSPLSNYGKELLSLDSQSRADHFARRSN